MGRSHITLERFEAVGRMFGLNVRYVVDDDGTFVAQMGEGPGGPGEYGTDAVLTYHSSDDRWLIRGDHPIERREAAVYLALYTYNRTADAEQLRSLLVETLRRLDGDSQTSARSQFASVPENNQVGRRREPWSGRSPRFLY